MTAFLALTVHAALLNNLLLIELLGIHELIAGGRRLDAARLLAIAFFCVITLVVPINAATLRWLLEPLAMQHLALLFYALNTLVVVYGLLMLLDKHCPAHAARGRALLPLLLLNSLLIGASTGTGAAGIGVAASIPWGMGAGLGVGVVWLLFTCLHDRIQMQQVPVPLRGLPIALLTLAIMAMAFSGLAGMLQ